jgi:dynactin 1
VTQEIHHAEDNLVLEPPTADDNISPVISSRPHSIAVARNPPSNTTHEDRARQAHVIKQLETKVRALQKQRQEDQTQLQNIQDLQSQTTRYEGIIQTLQKKLKTNQQEITELKAKYEDAEERASKVPEPSAEHESELELATLDKEMAEERAILFETELEALKSKHEELELEVEILREENRELTSVMTPEERAGSGWLQMERETERLRQALVMLRDMSHQNESDLKSEIKELQETLDDLEQVASKYEDTAAKLNRAEETNTHLREQLDALESNDEILEVMGAERDQNRHAIENLKRQIQDLEEHIQVTDELEAFHVEEEKRLHYQLDESEALLNEKLRQTVEQDKTIEDLEYTLNKFRDAVQGLQNDIDELRRSRDISELEAHEMSSKSRAMMDLNLKLQNSAAKTQLKAIDLELGKMRAEQASLHLEIVQLFIPDTFEMDKQPIVALLCFKRIKAKALLSKNILGERIRERPELVQDGLSTVFAVMEKMNYIANVCDRFVQHMSSCASENFMKLGGAPFELEPVEQSMTSWVEALRRDELAHDGTEHLHRMAGILVDMAEKFILESQESKSTELLASMSMVECYTDTIGSQAQMLSKAVQARLGSSENEDDTSIVFDKKMDQLGIKARTIKYVSSKIIQSLGDLRARSMSPGEAIWTLFSEAEQLSEKLSRLVREITQTIIDALNKPDHEEELSYATVVRLMATAAASMLAKDELQSSSSEDIFSILATQLQILQTKVDDLHSRSTDVNNAVEFEKLPAPWIARAKEVKTQKILSQDLQEEMARMKSRIQEQTMRVSERDKQLEEQQVKIELLESRAKETKAKDDGVKAMKMEIENLRSERLKANESLQNLEAEYQTLLKSQEDSKVELETIKRSKIADGQSLSLGVADESRSLRMKAEADLLKVELASLEAAVRFLKYENQRLRLPVTEGAVTATSCSWLDPEKLKPAREASQVLQIRSESKDIFTELIDMAKRVKPVKLKAKSIYATKANGQMSSWRPESDTTLYQILRQKEDLERWNQERTDVVKRARMISWSSRERSSRESDELIRKPGIGQPLTKLPVLEDIDMETESAGNGVRIVKH